MNPNTKEPPPPQQGQKLLLLSVIFAIFTYTLQESLAPLADSPLTPVLLPPLTGPETPLGRLTLTLFLTGKVSSLLLLNLGIHSLCQSLRLPWWIHLPLLLLSLSAIIHPPLLIPTLLCASILTLRSTHRPKKP
jgi:hypothetical protein